MRCVNERERTICYRNKQIDVNILCVCSVTENELSKVCEMIHSYFDNVNEIRDQ